MKVSTSVWVAALASWVFAGAAHAEEGATVAVAPTAIAVSPVAVASAPVVVPTQEVPAESVSSPAEAPTVIVPVVVIPPAAAAVSPSGMAPVVATSTVADPAGTITTAAPPPVAAPIAVTPAPVVSAPVTPAPAPASRDALADPFANPLVTPLWSTGASASSVGAIAPSATPPAEVTLTPVPIASQSPYADHRHARRPDDYRLGVGMMFGGGVTDFSSSTIREMTGTGGAWDARLIFGQREVLALETAYVGSAHYIRANGLDDDAMLVSNGAEGVLRLNIPVIDRGSIIEPFGFVGLGWSRYELTQTAYNHSNVAAVDNVMEVPYGAGLTMGADGFLVDIRFTYRATYYDNLLRAPISSTTASTAGESQRLDSWSLGAHVGFEF